MDVLSRINDHRLKLLSLPFHQGANSARNRGINASTSSWIALLDDDDEWLPTKLEEQLVVAQKSKYRYPIVSCFSKIRSLSHSKSGFYRVPASSEEISEFILVPSGIFHKRGFLGSPSLFASKDLFIQVPFNNNLYKCQDLDWVLRAVKVEGAFVEFVQKPLVIIHREERRERISSKYDWKYTLNWIRGVRQLVTSKAYAGFVLGAVADQAVVETEWEAFPMLLREAFSFGNPSFSLLLHYSYKWVIPGSIRNRLKYHFGFIKNRFRF